MHTPGRRVLMGLQFFPRGGSAHVALNLARNLPASGWRPRVLSGSLDVAGRPGDARDFYTGVDVVPVDMTAALDAPDPMLGDPPLHPSYEDRPDAPDRVFCALDDHTYEHHVEAWTTALQRARAAEADVLHLHHLTPLNAAARLVAPAVPVVGHLHGTELLMLEHAEEDPDRWPHARDWIDRMKAWAGDCERLIVLSENQVERSERLLEVDPERCVKVGNGYDPALFQPRPVERLAFWREQLVGDLSPFAPDGPVLLYVGRFTAVKRVGLLIEAYARARASFAHRAPLVLVGGFPGEHEGEHPADVVSRLGVPDVLLAGWHGHDELADFYNASDVVVLPSVREQFGQVLVEGMACGLPAIAVDAHGPAEIVADGHTGWLVEPDDVAGLADALIEAVNHPAERRRRGDAARADVAERFSWPMLAAEVAAVYDGIRTPSLEPAAAG